MRRATAASAVLSIGVVISIHALHEESDLNDLIQYEHVQFQSTLSMRRATNTPRTLSASHSFQSTLSMRRATAALSPTT